MKNNSHIYLLLPIQLVILMMAFLLTKPSNKVFEYNEGMPLDIGSYTVAVHYDTEVDAAYIIDTEGIEFADFEGSTSVKLPCWKNSVEQDFQIKKRVNTLSITGVNFSDTGGISEVFLYENWNYCKKTVTFLTVIFIAFDGLAFGILKNKKNILANRKIIVSLSAIVLFSSIPLYVKYIPMFYGQDTMYHLARIEGIYEGLLDGQFPVRIYPNVLNEYGEMIPTFYPDFFLYIPALLRCTGFSLGDSYRIFLFLLNIATTLITFSCLGKVYANKWIGVLGSLLYVLSSYRLTNMYMRSALGESIAMMFYPIILYGFYLIIFSDSKKDIKGWLCLTIGFSGILESHMLSFAMVLLFSTIIYVILWKRTFNMRVFICVLKAMMVSLPLNLMYICPFFVYYNRYGNVQTKATASLQNHGTYFAQLFQSFPNVNGESYWVGWGIPGNLPLNIGLPLIIGLFVFLLFCNDVDGYLENRLRKLGYLTMTMGCVCLYLTTYLFPWNKYQRLSSLIEKVTSLLQFPWRMLAPATFFFVLASCSGLLFSFKKNNEIKRMVVVIISFAVVIVSAYFFDECIKNATTVWIYDNNDIDSMVTYVTGEYLPDNVNEHKIEEGYSYSASSGIMVESFEKKGTSVKLKVNNPSASELDVVIPLIGYSGYIAENEYLGVMQVFTNEDGFLTVRIPAHFYDSISVRYKEHYAIRICQIISLLTVIIIIIKCIKEKLCSYQSNIRL